MLVSYKWLQEYFEDSLPNPKELGDLLTFHAFEIENIQEKGNDTLIDIDVLPNRSSDALSHRGIAKELSVLLGKPLKKDPLRIELPSRTSSEELVITIENPELCSRYSALMIKNVTVIDSPPWLKERLELLGQKSINNVVDILNYVMFDLGQPLHAFDADLLEKKDGKFHIHTRNAKENEHITLLNGTECTLTKDMLLIVDGVNQNSLGIAGIKGGRHAGVTANTKNIILESANFNPIHIRKSSKELKIRTDASARFENEVPREFTLYALEEVLKLITDIAGGENEGVVDIYPEQNKERTVSVSILEINYLLGTSITSKEVIDILNRFGFTYKEDKKQFEVTIPPERLDITIKEDLIEEIGRVYGYKNIHATPLSDISLEIEINKRFYYAQKIRSFLIEEGFSEVYTYTLTKKGDVELLNPIAKDRPFMRSSLSGQIKESLELNNPNKPLLGIEDVCLFEIGPVFLDKKDGEMESIHMALGVLPQNKKSNRLHEIKEGLMSILGAQDIKWEDSDTVVECNFDDVIKNLPSPHKYESFKNAPKISYKRTSPYPFVLRDIALFTPESISSDTVLESIQSESGGLLIRTTLFDEYKKDGKVSYAFHLVFQSLEKTLTDKEVNSIMDKITQVLEKDRGWEVR